MFGSPRQKSQLSSSDCVVGVKPGLAMSWELLRDLGLIVFSCGAVAVFGLRRLLAQRLGSADVAFIATVGDAMMLAGASVAVTAMTVGYLLAAAGPS